jgi:hypothetical protein
LTLGGTLTGTGNVTVDGLLTWAGGAMSGLGHTLANGGMALSGGTLDRRTLDNAGTATWTAGNLSALNGAVLNNLDGALFDARSDASFTGTGRFNNEGTFRKSASSGTTTLGLGFSNSGRVEVQTGTLNLTGPFTNFANQTLTGGTYVIQGTLQFTNAGINTNAATLVLDGGAARIVNLTSFASNTSAGSFTLQNGASLTTTGAFSNVGSVTIGAGSTFTATGAYTQTDGTTNLRGGTLAASLVDIRGSSLSGPGTINANVTNAGQVNVGGTGGTGTLTINGNYSQTPDGSLQINLGGLSQGFLYDWLNIRGRATLDGTLTVSLVNGFSPVEDDIFQTLSFSSRSGRFATTDFPALGDSLFFDPLYANNALILWTAL